MGCKCSRPPVPLQESRTSTNLPGAPQLPSLSEYIIPDPSPWITPISRARIFIPQWLAGDLEVHHEVFEKEPECEAKALASSSPEAEYVCTEDAVTEKEEHIYQESTKQKSLTLELPSMEPENHITEPSKEWTEISGVKNELLAETDPHLMADSGALVPFNPEDTACPSRRCSYGSPPRGDSSHPGQHADGVPDMTVVEAQTFVGRDESGTAHLINMHTIRHPVCKHDPLKGEIHIQITHKTPIHNCYPRSNEHTMRSSQPRVDVPVEFRVPETTEVSQQQQQQPRETMHIRMGVPVKHERCPPRSCCSASRQPGTKSSSFRCMPSPCTSPRVSDEAPDEPYPIPTYNQPRTSINYRSVDEILNPIDEPIIQPTSHVPPTKCSHSRYGDYQTNWQPDDLNKQMGITSIAQLETNSSAHSELFTDSRTLTRGITSTYMSPEKQSLDTSELSEGVILKSPVEFPTSTTQEMGSKTVMHKAATFVEMIPSGPTLFPAENPEHSSDKSDTIKSGYFTTEVTNSVPNETLEEWNDQIPVQHLGASSIHSAGTQMRMRDTRKPLKRAVLNRIAGQRQQDVVLQSAPSSDSVQNPIGLTPYTTKHSQAHQADTHQNVSKINTKQISDRNHLPVGKRVVQLQRIEQEEESTRSVDTPTQKITRFSFDSSKEYHKTLTEETSFSETNTTDHLFPDHETVGDHKPVAPSLPNKSAIPIYTRIQTNTSTAKHCRQQSPDMNRSMAVTSEIDCQTAVSSASRNMKDMTTRKRSTAVAPTFLPPIQSHTMVSTSVTATLTRTGPDIGRNMRETKQEVVKTMLSLPKLKQESAVAGDKAPTRNTHNAEKRKPQVSMIHDKGKPYDLLVLHQSKKK
ncbi:unnamed protein product [Echinostoma caproni]|uniref:Small conductance calcium-activated potassium channel protein n=1 Tax=Echinostoma caproni TaxID=27848 RepID=A0A182ZZK8_9TREM|nr:unnamed protein product [Echinostoma caproni]